MVDRATAGPVRKSTKEEMRMSKDGLCAIVTGSASGLGAATAVILAKDGARIVVNYSSSQKEAEQTADLCRSAGGEVVVVRGDVVGPREWPGAVVGPPGSPKPNHALDSSRLP